MGPRVWGVVIFVLVGEAVAGEGTGAAASLPALCPRPSFLQSVVPPSLPSCSIVDGGLRVTVQGGDEAMLRKAMYLIHNNKEDYVALLFYASWCPFSMDCQSNFNILQASFPKIHHFAFEESAIRRSVLSRYGVHGFPTLFLLNSTMRIRYHGSRRIDLLTTFYGDVTGHKPMVVDSVSMVNLSTHPSYGRIIREDEGAQNCPFSWARSPEKLLQQDAYLALATVFVTLRLLYFLWPRLVACCDCAWTTTYNSKLLSLSSAFFERGRRACASLGPYERKNLKGAKNAHAWASMGISIGEGSSRRGCSGMM